MAIRHFSPHATIPTHTFASPKSCNKDAIINKIKTKKSYSAELQLPIYPITHLTLITCVNSFLSLIQCRTHYILYCRYAIFLGHTKPQKMDVERNAWGLTVFSHGDWVRRTLRHRFQAAREISSSPARVGHQLLLPTYKWAEDHHKCNSICSWAYWRN